MVVKRGDIYKYKLNNFLSSPQLAVPVFLSTPLELAPYTISGLVGDVYTTTVYEEVLVGFSTVIASSYRGLEP